MKKEEKNIEMPALKGEAVEKEEKVEFNEETQEEVKEVEVSKEEKTIEPKTEEIKEEKSEKEIREELKKEIEEEIALENKKKKNHHSLFAIIFNLILIAIAVIFIFFMYFANQNFKAVQEGNEPNGYSNKRVYNENEHVLTVYEYGVYKIVVDNNGETTTYTLKPIFFNDYNA